MNRELRMLCAKTPSMMQDTSGDALAKFSWESVWEEITEKAPTLWHCCSPVFHKKTGRDKTPVICMCIAMLAKYRNPNMCHVQAAISLILHAGHVGTQVSYVSTSMQLFIYTLNLCIAMLAKYRNTNMCHVQAAISLILHARHVGTQVSYVSTSMQLFIYTFNSRFSGDCRSV